jgi:hypothetical protein
VVDPPGRALMAQRRYMAHGPRYGDAAPVQILDVIVFRRFPLTQDSFGREIGAIGSVMKFVIHPYKERPNPSSYASWASVLLRTASGIRDGVEIDFLWVSMWLERPLLGFSNSKLLSMHHLVLSLVPNHNIIIR